MTQLEGIRNFAVNIKPIMLKIKERDKPTPNELQSVLQFYLEVINYISKADFRVRRP